MKLIFAFLFFNLIAYLDACVCQKDQNVTYVVPSVAISEPTVEGTYGGTPCGPINCTTTVTIISPSNGTLYGGQIRIVGCDSFSSGDFFTILAGNQVVQNFTSCPNTNPPYTLTAASSNIISFQFSIKETAGVGFTAILVPTPATAPPTTTPPAVTTTPYPGPYSNDPSVQRVDLIVAVDLNKANTFFDQSKTLLQSFTNLFSYNNLAPDIVYPNTTHPYARLSLMSFDSYGTIALAPGNLPWSLNQSTLVGLLGTFHTYSPTSAKVFTALSTAFTYIENNGFTFRDNTQRVLVYFAGSDCDIADTNYVDDIRKKIDYYNLKVIVVTMNTQQQFSQVNYPCLWKLTGTASNVVNSYTYTGNGNPDLQSFISTVYQNGNQICQLPSSKTLQTQNIGIPIEYQIPLPNANNSGIYCNYMNNVQQYVGSLLTDYIQVLFTNLNTVYGSDSITIDINGTAVGSLSGQYGFNPYYCLPSGTGTVGVTFKSSGGKVLSGFTSYVTRFADNATCAAATKPGTTPAPGSRAEGSGFLENLEYRLMPLNKFF